MPLCVYVVKSVLQSFASVHSQFHFQSNAVSYMSISTFISMSNFYGSLKHAIMFSVLI